MAKRTTSDCLQLPVSYLAAAFRSSDSGLFHVYWKYRGSPTGDLVFRYDSAGSYFVDAAYSTSDHGLQRSLIRYEVAASSVGGHRYYWRCPNRKCDRRTTVLYRPFGGDCFLCRFCWNLAYKTQTESKSDRHWRKYHELQRELDDPRTPIRRQVELLSKYESIWHRASDPGMATVDRYWARWQNEPIAPRPPGRPSKAAARAINRRLRALKRGNHPERPPGRPKEKRVYVRRQPIPISPRTNAMQAYCPKCRDRRDLIKPKTVRFSNGRPAIQGRCAVCHTKTARIVRETGAHHSDAAESSNL